MKTPLVAATAALSFGLGLGIGLSVHRPETSVANGPAVLPSRNSERPQSSSAEAKDSAAKARDAEQAKREQRAQKMKERYDAAKPMIAAAMQLDDLKLREETLEKIRQGMTSNDPEELAVAFIAFTSLYDLDFDKASFRPVILKQLQVADEDLRSCAWQALMMSGLQPEDAALMRQVAKTQGMGDRTSFYLFQMEKGDLTGESGEIVRGLLDPNDHAATRSAMQGTWGSRYSPQLEADLIALSRQPEMQHDTIYYALSTQQNKSAATVDRLIEAMSSPESEDGGRAAWGLGQGVPKELASTVADAALKLVSSRSGGYVDQQAWGLLTRYAGDAQVDGLKALLDKPNLSADKRQKIQQLIDRPY